MRRSGFTLIEVMVVSAIIAILAGMMTPMVWKWWESEAVIATEEKLQGLKKALLGFQTDQQTGIRTMYGFVGDNGELPFCAYSSGNYSLSLVMNKPNAACSYPLWNGPYISGVNPTDAFKDNWGKDLSYMTCASADGRYLSGSLRSAGVDGVLEVYDSCDTAGTSTFCKGDDICVELPRLQVAPNNRVQGNFAYTGTTVTPSSVNFEVTYPDANISGGYRKVLSGCKQKLASFQNFTTALFDGSGNPVYLPIGKAAFKSYYYPNADCSGTATAESQFVDYFIHHDMSRLLINLPEITAP